MHKWLLSALLLCGTMHANVPQFRWPIHKTNFWISSYFGCKERGRMHKGLDLAAFKGTIVRASAAGTVEVAKLSGGYGNMVLVKHDTTFKTRYAHLDKLFVKAGEKVVRGQIIGHVGNTGHVTGKNGDHLHFEIIAHNAHKNPMRYLS